jgi:hypothetical protein|tara:strand:- start:2439 stop:2738 length:300 start_codon:yes stop_codon:yes gene_type:complete
MIKEKTEFGVIHKNLLGDMHHISFSKEFLNLAEREEKIVMNLIDNDYEILDKSYYYVGGETHEGADTYINLSTHEYHVESYSYVDYGVWKLKFKIKKKK